MKKDADKNLIIWFILYGVVIVAGVWLGIQCTINLARGPSLYNYTPTWDSVGCATGFTSVACLTSYVCVHIIINNRMSHKNGLIDDYTKELKEKLRSLKEERDSFFALLTGESAVFDRKETYKPIPVKDWGFVPSNNDTSSTIASNDAVLEEVKKYFPLSVPYGSTEYNRLVEVIAENCLQNGFGLSKIRQLTHTTRTEGKYVTVEGATSVGAVFAGGRIAPVIGHTSASHMYIPGDVQHVQTSYVGEETFQEMQHRVDVFFRVLGRWSAEYVISAVIPSLLRKHPEDEVDKAWNSIIHVYTDEQYPLFSTYIKDAWLDATHRRVQYEILETSIKELEEKIASLNEQKLYRGKIIL